MLLRRRCLRIRATPLGLARVAATAVQRVTISVAVRRVGRKVGSAFVRQPERALAAQRFISQTCQSVRSWIWLRLVALLGLAFETIAFRRCANASQCSRRASHDSVPVRAGTAVSTLVVRMVTCLRDVARVFLRAKFSSWRFRRSHHVCLSCFYCACAGGLPWLDGRRRWRQFVGLRH